MVVIKDTELLSKANDAASTTGSKLLTKLVQEVIRTLGLLGSAGRHFLVKNLARELFVVNVATSVEIIDAEKSIKVLLGWDHNTNFLNSFCELIRLDAAIVVQVEVLEGPNEDSLLTLMARGLLGELLDELFLKTNGERRVSCGGVIVLPCFQRFHKFSFYCVQIK